jgi:hypothetical protein
MFHYSKQLRELWDWRFRYPLRGLRQSNNLKTIAKLEKYKMCGIDTSRDKSRDFDLVSLTSWLTLTAKFSLAIDKIYFLTFTQFPITIATTLSTKSFSIFLWRWWIYISFRYEAILLYLSSLSCWYWTEPIIIISLLMSPLLRHTPSLWITHKENGP